MLCTCMAEWQAVEPRVKKTFLPIFWVEEKSQATPAQCNTFKKQVNRGMGIAFVYKCTITA